MPQRWFMSKRTLALGAALVVVAAASVPAVLVRPPSAQGATAAPQGAYTAPVDVDTAGLPGPRQPIFYRHDVHAGQYQIDCRYCHFSVETSSSAGLPTLSTCMGCHRTAGLQNPEVQKLQQAFNSGQGVEWVEIHKLAPFVHFPHMRHVNSNLGDFRGKSVTEKCEVCHGPIRETVQVSQFSSLKMGWCVDCHIRAQQSAATEAERKRVSRDCTVCHY